MAVLTPPNPDGSASWRQASPSVLKWLQSDGSVLDQKQESFIPPNPNGAQDYRCASPNIAKWLLSDGSIVDALPYVGGESGNPNEETLAALAAALEQEALIRTAEDQSIREETASLTETELDALFEQALL